MSYFELICEISRSWGACNVLEFISLSLLPSVGWETFTSQETMSLLCGWEGNCRSGVSQAMRHTCGLSSIRKEDELLRAYTPCGKLSFIFLHTVSVLLYCLLGKR